ncbi:MAG TPA: hypothetical protein PKM51_04145 [Chitinophagales bacterium]|nr:hypothetical protein [Chitinophagales bacterium]HNM31917.1 hypothetical protein [Chitinophagales bacterium]
MFLKKIIPIVLFCFANAAFAQIDKADKLIADYKYAQAIALLKPTADKGNIRAVRKIAECYRKINDYENAEKYYAIVVADKNAVPKSFLYYGQVLITNEKCNEAKIWLEKFILAKTDKDSVLAKTLLESCIAGKVSLNTTRNCTVQNLKALNSSSSDFCAFPYENGIVFTSARQGKINGTSGLGYQAVYYARYKKDSTFEIEALKGVVNTKGYNSGPACIDTLHDVIYFTKNNFQYGDAVANKKGEVTLKIFSAKKNRDAWHDIKELELNDVEYSCAFPSINKDGNILFFTSDRGGGFGGKDIYYSVLQNGVWSKPKNAGKNINTSGDERYPFIHSDGTLFFSSTGLPGNGGMDIFKSVPNKLGEWGKPENLGKPFNSTADDFGFYLDGNYEYGYFSSNRSGGMGNDDIYSFQYNDIPFELNLYANGKPADSIHIRIIKDGLKINEGVFDKKLTDYLLPNCTYLFECTKEGFVSEQVIIKTTTAKKPISKPINLLAK